MADPRRWTLAGSCLHAPLLQERCGQRRQPAPVVHSGATLLVLLPTARKGWWRFFFLGAMESLRAVAVMDYQNVHLTAHDTFDLHGEKHDALIHPMLFGREAVDRRNESVGRL